MSIDHVRSSYSARAEEYVEALGSMAAMSPIDRALVSAWAAGIGGAVVDAGCGPGHWTKFLQDQGVAIEGVDMVPEFVDGARERFPDVTYRLGRLQDLEVPDGSLAGVLSWFSIIHTPPEDVGEVLAEFARCVEPGGGLLLGFCDGTVVEPFDHKVVTAYFWPVEEMSRELRAAGFEPIESHARTEPGRRAQAAIVARRASL